jgi:PmbA protein
MMNSIETAKYAVARLIENGAAKAQCQITKSEKHELNVAIGNISLFRTTFNTAVDLLGLVDSKKGTVMINKTDTDLIEQGVNKAIELAGSSKADPANDIAGNQPPKSFISGPARGDLDTMYIRLKEFLAYSKETYPKTLLEEVYFDFTQTESIFVNSNGVEFRSDTGTYNFGIVFTSKKGDKTSSMNYAECRFKDLNSPIKDIGGIDRLFTQSAQQLDVDLIPEKFDGPVIIAPECLSDFIGFFTGYISNVAMITGNSVYKDKLNQKIADSRLTLHSKPVSSELASTYYFTDDGYEAKNSTIIANGILQSFLLNLYAANKTGQPKADNMGGCYLMEAGDSSLDQMIQTTPKGILLCRFSGGNPGDNGDFSGVAKNSYYIENGKIQYPIKETMVSGNIVAMLNNIDRISKERNNDGYNYLPWIKFNGITISGKY